jgi:hypothetical protein
MSPTAVRHPLPWLFLAAATLLGGCVDPYHDPHLGIQEVPADFALIFNVQNPATSDDPLRQSSQYVLEPDRNLRVALGSATSEAYFPRLTRQITPEEYAAVSRLAQAPALLSPRERMSATLPTGEGLSPGSSPTTAPAPPASAQLSKLARPLGSPPAGPVVYRLTIMANGRVQSSLTTPEDSPAAADLLHLLVQLRGGRPVPATQP